MCTRQARRFAYLLFIDSLSTNYLTPTIPAQARIHPLQKSCPRADAGDKPPRYGTYSQFQCDMEPTARQVFEATSSRLARIHHAESALSFPPAFRATPRRYCPRRTAARFAQAPQPDRALRLTSARSRLPRAAPRLRRCRGQRMCLHPASGCAARCPADRPQMARRRRVCRATACPAWNSLRRDAGRFALSE